MRRPKGERHQKKSQLFTYIQRVLNDLERTRLSSCRVIWLLPNPLPPSPVCKLNWRHTGKLRKRDNLPTGEGGGLGGGAKSYSGEKAWFSMNPSILSAYIYPHSHHRDIRNIKKTHTEQVFRGTETNMVIFQQSRLVLEKQAFRLK